MANNYYGGSMAFDDVYGNQWNGMDTYSQIGPEHFGGSSSSHQQPRSVLGGAGNMMMTMPNISGANMNPYAGNATRSQITSANFGGVQQQNMSFANNSRFAGMSTRSSLSIANFGGDGRSSPDGLTLKVTQHNPVGMMPNSNTRSISPLAAMQQQQTQQQQHYQAPTGYESPYQQQFNMQPESFARNISPSHPPRSPQPFTGAVSPEQVDRMIREIAELRIDKQKLEEEVAYLTSRLRMYEG